MESWLTIKNGVSQGSGNGSFTIVAEPHTGRAARNGSVYVTGNGLSPKKVNVTQSGAAVFVSFGFATYSVPMGGAATLTISGKSNSPYINFRLIGNTTVATAGQSCQMKFYDGNTDKGTTWKGKNAGFVTLPSKYTIGSNQFNTTGSSSLGTLGTTSEYSFSIVLTIPANTGILPQKLSINAVGSETNATATSVIELAAAEEFLNLDPTEVSFNENGGDATISVESNTSWSIS